MKTAFSIAILVILAVVATAAYSWAQLDFPVERLLASSDLQAEGELPPEAELTASGGPAAETTEAPGDAPQPLAVAEETEFNFGYLENGAQDNRHSFIIKNEGTAPLKLVRSEVSCSKCTFASLPGEPIPPGGSAAVQVRWNINIENDVFRQHVDVHTNDRKHPLLRLMVTGNVVRPFQIKPGEIVFSNVRVGEEARASAMLLSYFSDDLQVLESNLSSEALAPYFGVELTPVAADKLPEGVKSAVEINVLLKPGLPLGAFKQRILLKTNLEKGENLELPVTGSITGPVSIVASGWNQDRGVLQIRQVTRGKGAVRELSLIIRGKEFSGLKVKPPTVTPSLVKVTYGEIKEVNGGATTIVPVRIEIPPGSPSVNHMGSEQGKLGEIIIPFDKSDLPPVKLLVQFAVVEG
jgi:hypothetical protein